MGSSTDRKKLSKKDKEKKESIKSEKEKKEKTSGHLFIKGCVLGLIVGIFLGWWFRPPSSFPIEELKKAMTKKVLKAKDTAKKDLADFAEDLAEKLRKSRK